MFELIFALGPTEIALIAIVVLVLFGLKKLQSSQGPLEEQAANSKKDLKKERKSKKTKTSNKQKWKTEKCLCPSMFQTFNRLC